MTPCQDRFDYVQNKWKNVRWSEMNLATQRAWLVLEHTPELWAKGWEPRTKMYRWDELSLQQQQQAAFLGHSHATWQGCFTYLGSPTQRPTPSPTSKQNTIPAQRPTPSTRPTPDTPPGKNPLRSVRVRMTIERSFTEISGNVYGQEVGRLPTSFVDLFERSVARALFCDNPPMSTSQKTYVGADGLPLCVVLSSYLAQRSRVKVITVKEGSIIVDFYLLANKVANHKTSVQLLNMLENMLENPNSALCMDPKFGRFASKASVKEVPYALESFQRNEKSMEMENLRGSYADTKYMACLLNNDARIAKEKCKPTTSGARVNPRDCPLTGALLAAVLLAYFG